MWHLWPVAGPSRHVPQLCPSLPGWATAAMRADLSGQSIFSGCCLMGQASGIRTGNPFEADISQRAVFSAFRWRRVQKGSSALPAPWTVLSSCRILPAPKVHAHAQLGTNHSTKLRAWDTQCLLWFAPLCWQRRHRTEPSPCSCPGVMLERPRAGVWQHENKALRHLEDHSEDRDVGISTFVLELKGKRFCCLGSVVPRGNSESVLSRCSLDIWREEAAGDESVAVMGLYLPLHNCWKHPCQENSSIPPSTPSVPSIHLPQSFLFQMICISEVLLVLKQK